MADVQGLNRRSFLHRGVKLSAAAAALGSFGGMAVAADETPAVATSQGKRLKVGVIGCGSVSTKYLPHLSQCPFVELVSTCDIVPERAKRAAARHQIANHYPHIEEMLNGVPFDLLVVLTDMQVHEEINRRALDAGKHVWSEKPMANSLAAARDLLALAARKGVRFGGAPTVVNSPQFKWMAQALAANKLGRVAAASASYGWTGPEWSAFFYKKGGGSLPDLGVYNLTTLTGLLGPAKAVSAMTSIVTASRNIEGKGEIQVESEDNAMVMMDHGNGVLSHVQCGFNYFTAREHDFDRHDHHTITLIGAGGTMSLAGYDWAPHAVDLATRDHPALARFVDEGHDYVWQQGASVFAECLLKGQELPFKPEHALHVLEIMIAARESQRTGQRISIESRFVWPLPGIAH